MRISKANRYQKRFYLEWALDPKGLAYNTPLIYRVKGELALSALQKALDHFVNIHDVGCRSIFKENKGEIEQHIQENVLVELKVIVAADETMANNILDTCLQHTFDLQNGPLFEFSFIKLNNQSAILVLNFHHIITDANSAMLFVQALHNLYCHYCFGETFFLEENQYFQLSDLDQNALQQENTDLQYWKKLLAHRKLYIDLPKKISLKKSRSYGDSNYFDLDPSLYQASKSFCRHYGCTLFILFSAIFAVTLSQYSSQKELVINYPVNMRKNKKTIGCFVNNLPLVCQLTKTSTLLNLVEDIKHQRKAGRSHEQLSLTDLVQALRKEGELSDDKFLNVAIIEAYFDDTPLDFNSASLYPINIKAREIPGELTLAYQALNERIRFRIDYQCNLFEKELIDDFCEAFQFILKILLENPTRYIEQHSLLHSNMVKRLQDFSNAPSIVDINDNKLAGIVGLFSDAAKKQMNKTAIYWQDETVSYKDLFNLVKKINSAVQNFFNNHEMLIEEKLVGVYLKQKINVPAAFLAILSSGCAYVPMDTQQPLTRLREVIRDSGLKVIITERSLAQNLGQITDGVQFLYLDEIKEFIENESQSGFLSHNHELAYMIYTSGSTGRPKGVMIENISLNNVLHDFIKRLQVTEKDRIASPTSMSFDIFGLEIYLALCTGATLLLLDNEVKETQLLAKYLTDFQPTVIQGTPSFWTLLTLSSWSSNFKNLRILCGGEALSQTLAQALLKISSEVYQVYGPTETTIWSTCKKLQHESEYALIGRPISNTFLYVLDENQQPVPCGAVGELYIGGIGLSRGYYRQVELTQQRFIQKEKRLYKTGDKVCWTSKGDLVYLGRLDFQVKIRGHRIELGEIEYYLNQYPGVSQAIVQVFGEEQQKYLVAYLLEGEKSLQESEEKIKTYLRERLPFYMMPSQFVFSKDLPLTVNGKVDRQALLAPISLDNILSPSFKNEIEQQLFNIWSKHLQISNFNLKQHFFELGGHSLLAAQMLVEVNQIFNITLTLADLITHPTIEELAHFISHQDIGNHQNTIPYLAQNEQFSLSVQQKQLLFVDQYSGKSNHFYHLSIVNQLCGPLQVDAFFKSLNNLIERHEMLRVVFEELDGQWKQRIQAFTVLNEKVEEIEKESSAVVEELILQPFDLTRGPLYRIRLFKLAADNYLFVFIVPHIIIDGWSFNILNKELSVLYNAYSQKKIPLLNPLTHRYHEFVAWQSAWLTSNEFNVSSDYWSKKLSNYQDTNLSTDFLAPKEKSYRGAHYHFKIETEIVDQLQQFAKKAKTTLFNVLLSAYTILIGRYSRQKDLVIAVPAANRRDGTEHIVGLFTTLLPIRLELNEHQSFIEFLKNVSSATFEATLHQSIVLEKIPHVFKVVFALQNANDNFSLALDGLSSIAIMPENHVAKFDIFLDIRQVQGELHCSFEYATDLFLKKRIERMSLNFVELLLSISKTAEKISDIRITPFTNTNIINTPAVSTKKNLITLFIEQVIRAPHNIAITDGNTHITYYELDQQSTRLAKYIRNHYKKIHNKELAEDVLIAVCVERSRELLVGLLAVLKAGGAYVPLDPHYPRKRLEFILNDSNASLFLTTKKSLHDSHLSEALSDEKIIVFDEIDIILLDEVLPVINAEALAYVIYTSGSTGTPKGALLTHYNVQRLFEASKNLFHFSDQDVWCMFHSFAFDFSVWEIWGALLYGGRLVIVPYHCSRDPHLFRQLLQQEKVTVLNQTPTAFSQLISIESSFESRLFLRYVIFGGEALNITLLKNWWAIYPNSPQIVNMYGITETTVHVTFRTLTPEDLQKPYCNDIGKPLPDLRAYVLDEYYNLSPVGVPGELYIAGPGLARGYLNRADLTEKAFILGTKLGIKETRLYKTGDLARWLDNGNLEYLGRNDHQVKIRGFRIELGEIQAVLMTFSAIKDAFVFHHQEHDEILAFYISDERLASALLHAFLKERLPDFMLPHRLIQVPFFPLTANGKIDRDALLSNNAHHEVDRFVETYIPPSTEYEIVLEKIWCTVLNQKKLGIQANFFTSGGDSIRALELVQLAKKEGLIFTPRDLFQYPTIAELAEKIQFNDSKTQLSLSDKEITLIDPKIKRKLLTIEDEDIYPLAALQEGMLFHSEATTQSSTYIDIISCQVEAKFTLEFFQEILNKIVQNNPILRATFLYAEGQYWQRIKKNIQLPLQIINSNGKSVSFYNIEQPAFLLEKDVLWRIKIYLLSETSFHLVLICHHAILDGWSVAVFLTQILKNYALSISGQELNISKPCLTYRDFVQQEMQLRQDKIIQNFWINKLNDVQPCFIAKNTEVSSSNTKRSLAKKLLEIDSRLFKMLQLLSKKWHIPLDIILFTAHLWTISRLTGRRDIVTGIASNSRLVEDEGNQVLGLFLNSMPFRFNWSENISILTLLRAVMAEKQLLYPYRGYPLLDIQRTLKSGLIFDTLFNFIHFHVFDELKKLEQLKVKPSYCYEETNFSLITQAEINLVTEALEVTLVYNRDVLDEEKINLMGYLYIQALHACITYGNENVERLPFFVEDFPFYLKPVWNKGPQSEIQAYNILEVFNRQVSLYPHNIAVQSNEGSLTYQQLNEKAEGVASFFAQLPDEPLIGFFATREISTIVTILAILKVGGAYVPLDPDLPVERLQQMIEECHLAFIIGTEAISIKHVWLSDMPFKQRFVLYSTLCGTANQLLKKKSRPQNRLAYVMYTSGSTGRPKGVMIDHRAILRLVKDTNYISIHPSDRIAQAASLCFDAATFEIWGALLTGATLVLVPSSILLEGKKFAAYLDSQKITILWLTARLFDQYIYAHQANIFKNLRYLLIGGDVLNKQTVQEVLNCSEGRPIAILNGYGPTENTTFTCVHEINAQSLTYDSIPIGKPISNTEVYILDELYRSVPIGVIGELYVGGEGLAHGYLNAPELTNERFINIDLYDAKLGAFIKKRLYRTYDAVRWLKSGEIEYIGRIDRSTKINGYRVSLAEIESIILNESNVKDCVVIEITTPRKKLIAYYLDKQGQLTPDTLYHSLQKHLPHYMMPHVFIQLDEFPLTQNGKVDVKALPAPVASVLPAVAISQESETVQKLHEIWTQLLEVTDIKIHDHFFDRGGDSLLAMQLHHKIKEIFQVELSIVDIFRYSSIAELAYFLDAKPKQSNKQIHHQEKQLAQRLRIKKLLKK